MKINTSHIGSPHPVYIIAEMSGNHNQSYDQAVKIIEEAKKAGVNAIKIQTYTQDTLTIKSDKPYFKVGAGTLWEGKTLYDLYGEAFTPWEWQPKLMEVARKLGLDFFSSPFDFTAVDFLEKMNVPAYKIASFELIDLPLIARVAKTGKPLIMSTGLANFAEINDAIVTAKTAGAKDIALLKCTSGYPALAEEMNLNTIPDLKNKTGCLVGLSDHTLGSAVPISAVALGACIIEKHFTLSRKDPGPDSAFSLEPSEFTEMVNAIRTVEKSLGTIQYGPTEAEKKSLTFRRSLFVVEDIKAGELLTEKNIRSIRPANGLPPKFYSEVLGKKAKANIEKGTPLTWDSIERT